MATLHSEFVCPSPGTIADTCNFWPDLLFEPESANQLDQNGIAVSDQDHPSDMFSHPAFFEGCSNFNHDDRSIDSLAGTIRELANLSIALYDCAANLPSQSKACMKLGGTNNEENTWNETTSRQKRLFVLDEVFRLTTKFIDVVGILSGKGRDPGEDSPISAFTTPNTEVSLPIDVNQQMSYDGAELTANGSKVLFSHVDEATILMLMSCHCRLTEIYLSIFQMMQACIEYSFPPQVEDTWTVVLPQLQMGSHAAPPIQVDANTSLSRVTASMYMLMITMFSSQLCARVADVMGAAGNQGSYGRKRTTHLQDLEEGGRLGGAGSSSRSLFEATVEERTIRLEQVIKNTKIAAQRFSLATE